MTDYYLCSKEAALQYCKGIKYMNVHYSHIANVVRYRSEKTASCALMNGRLDDDIVLMLSLKDPLFRKVTEEDMSDVLIAHVGTGPWKYLND